MVASRPPDIVTVPLEDVVGKQKLVPVDFDLIRTARALGIAFGDESIADVQVESPKFKVKK
jgi:6-phosphofructokinase 1